MRTHEIFKYLVVMIMALSTSVNVFAQEQRTMKIYFQEFKTGSTGVPRFLVRGDVPIIGFRVIPKPEGITWANSSRFFEWINQDVTDRLVADYVIDGNGNVDKKHSHMKISFTNFPYEVTGIQWNAMNDLLSGSVTDWFKNYNVTTKCTPESGSGFSYTEEHWSMNVFSHQTSFNQGDIPWKSGAVLNGLKSFEISEKFERKIGIGSWTWWDLGEAELSAKVRTFIKAGWDGISEPEEMETNDNPIWAFSIKYTLPVLSLSFTDGRTNNTVYFGEQNKAQLQAGISHAGAIVPTQASTTGFHYEFYENSNNVIISIDKRNGLITGVRKSGSVDVTVKLMYNKSEISSYTQTIYVMEKELPATAPEICIGFVDGKKGYDVTVGDQNAQIQGFVTKGTQPSGSHFEYSEASNGQIITINKTTGAITPLKEGDVSITAVLKDNNGKIVSYPYSYTLHVFAENEGLEWQCVNTYRRNQTSGNSTWKVGSTSYNSYDWQTANLLKVSTSIDPSGTGWKQIASFNVTSADYWRAICEKLRFNVKVPKYSKATATYSFAGNVAIGDKKIHQTDLLGLFYSDGSCKYGLEVKDLGVVSANVADSEIKKIEWNTNNQSSPSSPTDYTTIAINSTKNYQSNIGSGGDLTREIDNSTGKTPITESRYLAVMAYLWDDEQYPGDASFGFKNIPEYTYYSTVTYYKNDGTEEVLGTQSLYSNGKTGTMALNCPTTPTRTGYEFLGWDTNKNARTVVYPAQGDFCSYDTENGGGKGPVELYAVWRAMTYTVNLDPQGGTINDGITSIIATYGEPLPSGLTAPTKPGYEFKGYYSNNNQEYAESMGQDYGGTQYYDNNMVGAVNWENTNDATIYAHWAPKTYIVTFDAKDATLPQGIIDGNKDLAIVKASDGIIKIRFTYGVSVNYTIDNSKPKKPAYQLLGFYDENDVLVATITVDDPYDRHIYITGAGNYWEQNGDMVKWVHDGDLTLTARYEPKFTVEEGNIIKFGSEEKKEIVEPKHDWLMAVVNDLVGAAQEVGSKENPVMVFDMTNSINIWTGGEYDCQEVMASLQDLIKDDIISPNVLVYFNEKSYAADKCNNAILSNMTCPNLYVTDRYQMKIPYEFNAIKATYERNKDQIGTSDGMWEQSQKSIWGTLCLPYPIKNNNTHKVSDAWDAEVDCKVIFYELRRVIDREGNDNDLMQFYKLPEDEEIPANTPVLYERIIGKDMGSAVIIEERSGNDGVARIKVPENRTYKAVTKTYANASEPSIHDWQFVGSLSNIRYCGVNFDKTKRDGTEIEVYGTGTKVENGIPGYIYYFKQDKFTRLANNGRATVYPYRGYFYYNPVGDNTAKDAYSILVVDENGSTTDITDTLTGNGEGDGKIYDLNGIRVMHPVKGRLYIVNGKKKVY